MIRATISIIVLTILIQFICLVDCSAELVFDNLWLGDCEAAHNQSFIRDNNIRLIVTVTPATECATPPFHLVVEHRRFDLLDDGMHKIEPILNVLTEKLELAEKENKQVLLHW
jgi:hypothetical protein